VTPLDDLPECTAPGACIDCHAWTAHGRVVREIHTDSGAGGVAVRCAGCMDKDARRPSRQPLIDRGRQQGRASA
jgi:hypothetical protein